MNKIIYSCVFIFLTLLFSCNSGVKQEDNKKQYTRIVSLDGSISEILCQLGQEANIVATDITSNYPASLAEKPKVGHNRNISAEGVLAQNPEVVLTIDGAVPPQILDQIKLGGAKVIALPHEYSVEGTIQLAESINDSLQLNADLSALKSSITSPFSEVKSFEEKPKVLFIYARGVSTLLVAGKNTQMAKAIELAGAENAANEFDDFKPLTPEALAVANPDAILMFDSGLSSLDGDAGLLNVPGVEQTTAGQNKAFIAMDGQYIAGFGPRLGEAILDLNKKLHALNEEK